MYIFDQLANSFFTIGAYAHPDNNGKFPFPFSYPPAGETPTFNRGLRTTFQRGPRGFPENMQADAPTYALNIPFTPLPTRALSQRKWDHLTRVIRDESFGQTAHASQQVVGTRIFATIGINRARSMDQEEDREVLSWSSALPLQNLGFPCRTITTLWEPNFLLSGFNVDIEVVQVSFIVLEYLVGTPLAKQAQSRLSSESFRKQIPFTHIREWIKDDTFQLGGFQQLVATRHAYLSIMDDDPISFRHAHPVGLFSAYDDLVLDDPVPQLVSTGYYAGAHEDLGTQLALYIDMQIRFRVGQHLSRGVYFPEPNTCVLLSDPNLWTGMTFVNSESLDTENRRLITNLAPYLDPIRINFAAIPCLSTQLPERMRASEALAQLDYQHVGKLSMLKALKGISQTHAGTMKLSNNIYVGIPHEGFQKSEFLSMFSPLYHCFDPIALAQAMKNGKYTWKHFKFMMTAYPVWRELFVNALDSDEALQLNREAWGVQAKALMDQIWPKNKITAAAYEAGFQAHIENYQSAIKMCREKFKLPDAQIQQIVDAASAAGMAIYETLQTNLAE